MSTPRSIMSTIFVVSLLVAACLPSFVQAQSTIADIVVNSEDHTVLELALTEAGLVDTFSGEGSYTVFAPTDAAFTAFLESKNMTSAELLASPDLATYLQYHVVPSEVMSGDLVNGGTAETLAMLNIGFDLTDGAKIVHGGMTKATVTGPDVDASNGVVHVIDTVLEFPTMTITDLVASTADLSTLLAAVEAAELGGALAGDGPFTVFAPTNAGAEYSLGALNMTASQLLDSGDLLTKILMYHVHSGEILSANLTADTNITTLAEIDLPFMLEGMKSDLAVLTLPSIVTADVMATNGKIPW